MRRTKNTEQMANRSKTNNKLFIVLLGTRLINERSKTHIQAHIFRSNNNCTDIEVVKVKRMSIYSI